MRTGAAVARAFVVVLRPRTALAVLTVGPTTDGLTYRRGGQRLLRSTLSLASGMPGNLRGCCFGALDDSCHVHLLYCISETGTTCRSVPSLFVTTNQFACF